MPRAKKSENMTATEALLAEKPGLGNLSEADLAAIRGEIPVEGEARLAELDAALSEAPKASDAEVSLGGRLLSLETRVRDLEAALEGWAERLNQGQSASAPTIPIASQDMPMITGVPTAAEERAYNRANLALSQQRKAGYNGLQAWRNAGSPVLEPEEKAA